MTDSEKEFRMMAKLIGADEQWAILDDMSYVLSRSKQILTATESQKQEATGYIKDIDCRDLSILVGIVAVICEDQPDCFGTIHKAWAELIIEMPEYTERYETAKAAWQAVQ